MDIDLRHYGLSDRVEQQAALVDSLRLARVTEQHRALYRVMTAQGEVLARVSGKLAYQLESPVLFPAVGDWVMMEGQGGDATIHQILPRSSLLTRQAAGTAAVEQAIAANIDIIFICMSLNADFNVRRVERYLALAWDSSATPVIVLTKTDLCDDLPQRLQALSAVSAGVEVILCSAQDDQGVAAMDACLAPNKTGALVGSSGVGKSTLINRLMGQDVLAINSIRQGDDRGRHTTTHRQLLRLPSGGIVIDTPGMRELQLSTGNLSKTFEDIETLAARCKYSDCSHGTEPGCAVRAAIEAGLLDRGRFDSYEKLQRELSYEGLNSRQLENEKINRMFGSKGEMKQMLKEIKQKNKR